MKNAILLGLTACIGLGLTLWALGQMWAELGITMTLHGWIAYGLGAAFSVSLASGLFYLVFKSAREGYDDFQKTDSYED